MEKNEVSLEEKVYEIRDCFFPLKRQWHTDNMYTVNSLPVRLARPAPGHQKHIVPVTNQRPGLALDAPVGREYLGG
jgi:hypothetical protein